MFVETCRVLLVDDDEDDYVVTRDFLSEAGQRVFELTWVNSYEAGLEAIHQDQHDVYLLDFRLGQQNGLELLQTALQQNCVKPIILLTAVGDHDIDQQAMANGASDYLVKGNTLNHTLLERSILHAIERKRSERQQAELVAKLAAANQELFEKEAQLQDFFDNANDLVQSVRVADGTFEYVNQVWRQTLGYSAEEVEQLTIFDILHPAYHSHCQELIAQLRDGYPCTREHIKLVFLTKDQQEIIVEGSINCRLERDRLVAIRAIFRDVTERTQYERQLHSLSERLQLAARSANIGIWDWDIVSDCLTWDNRMYELYNIQPDDFLGTMQAWQQRIHADDLVAVTQRLQQALRHEQEFEAVVFRILHPDGSIRWIEAYALVQHNAESKPERMIGVSTDISDRKTAEVELKRTNAELARATRLKDEFLANMSHELRTPLNAILGMTEALQEHTYGRLNVLQQGALQTVEQSSNHLLDLINDILDLAKIEAGQMELDHTLTNIQMLCQSSLMFIKQQAFRKRIQTEIDISDSLSQLMLDERRIRQVLINLLSNAVKFTPEQGKVTLKVELEMRPDTITSLNINSGHSTAWLRFTVIDTGIGINQDDLAKLFQPFIQIDSALNRQYAGTGLGLSLVKRVVEMHGGQVGVTSQKNRGSQFWFTLPYQEKQLQHPPTIPLPKAFAPKVSPIERHILLAEDNMANIQTLSNYLKTKGYTVTIAVNGEEAVEMAQTQLPDIILMDIQMPKVDGLEAIRQIRQNPNLQEIPIVALTALAMSEDQDRCLAAGATDYLSKPIKLSKLAKTIQTLLNKASTEKNKLDISGNGSI